MNENRKTRRSTVAVLVAAVVLLLSIWTYYWEHRFGPRDIQRLSHLMRVELPPSARITQRTVDLLECDMTYYIFAEVEVDRRDVGPFIDSIKAQARRAKGAYRISRTDKLWILYEEGDPYWWKPDGVKKFIAVLHERVYWMLVDLDDRDRAVLYVHTWTK